MGPRNYNFQQVFQENFDGSITTRFGFYVNGVWIPPQTVMRPGLLYSGINFFLFKNRIFVFSTLPNGSLNLTGFA